MDHKYERKLCEGSRNYGMREKSGKKNQLHRMREKSGKRDHEPTNISLTPILRERKEV